MVRPRLPLTGDPERDRKLEAGRRYREANAERIREAQATWNAEHREQNAAAERKRQERRRRQEVQRQKDRERVKAWAAEHPEQVKARRDKWLAENRERQREHARNYYHRHKEERQKAARAQNAKRREDPAYRKQEAEYAAGRREVLNEQQRQLRSDTERRAAHNEEQNTRRKVDRRLHKLGLPPRPKHRWTIDERAEAEAAAAAAVKRRWTKKEINALEFEARESRAEAWPTSETAWHASTESRLRAAIRQERELETSVTRYLASPVGRRLREEVRMDSRARELRGADSYPDLDAEARLRARVNIERASTESATGVKAPPFDDAVPGRHDGRGLAVA